MESEREQSPADQERNRERSRSPVGGRNESQSPGDRRRERGHRNKENRNRSGRSDVITCRRVFISNIPYELKWQNIKDLFREKVGEVTFVELHENPDGKSKGCGVVEFKDKDSVKKAIEVMHRYEIKGRQLVVKEDKEELREKSMAVFDRGSGGIMGGGMMGSGFNTFGISPQILQQLGISGPLTNKVFVANLDYKVNWQKLREIFKMAGNVIRAELKLDRDGKSKGHGVVEFEHPVEAVQAISMFNGQMLYERAMSVRMDKYGDGPGMQDDGPMKLPGGLRSIGMGLGSGGMPINLNTISNMGNFGMGGGMGNMGGMGSGGGGMGGGGMGNMGGMGGPGMGMNDMSMGNMGMNNMAGNFGAMGGGMGNSDMSLVGNMANMGGGLGGGTTGMGMGGGGGGGGAMGTSNMNMGAMGMGGSGMGMGMGSGNMGSGMGGGMGSGIGGGGMGGGMGSGMGGMGSGMGGGMGMGGMGGGKGGFGGAFGSMGDLGMGHKDDRDLGRRDRSNAVTSVFIRNLPFSYTWQLLRDKFTSIGEVKFAEIKNKGCGIVRFAYSDDAQRAVDLMNGARIEGRDIDVRLDRM